eukprot:5311741-Prymnesium_polylepis.1
MHCCILPNACLDVFPNPYVWKQWRNTISRHQSPKQLQLSVAGLNEHSLRGLEQNCMLGAIKDPTFSHRLRHLEKDIVHVGDPNELYKNHRLWDA